MPCVGVRITKDDVTAGQKRWVVEEITRTLVNVLVQRPEHIHLFIDEVESENRGYAGMLTTDYRGSQDATARAARATVGSRDFMLVVFDAGGYAVAGL